MSDLIAKINQALEGRYVIERQVGQGGMATVFLATDLRHDRHVALKVLKPELAAVVGAERFLAEIKTTANLQHPHILPLFDSGQADGFLFYVMPYVEGETLRDKLDRDHQLPVDDAVRLTINVAEALEYAHSRGVIHRDIKPANILLQAGKPVLSDFGIALAVGAAGGGRLTETGLSMGTPHYMSPEQATGDLSVGPTTDIYALGCVLFEMLVGEPPYTGGTAQAILGKIITESPALASGERPSVPANVDAAIHRALEKVPADRFASAGEFATALVTPSFRHGAMAAAGSAGLRGLWNPLSIAATATAGILVAGTTWSLSRPSAPPEVTSVEIRLDDEEVNGFALSPDGSFVLYGVRERGVGDSRLRRLNSLTAEALPLPCCNRPRISPDGQSYLDFDGGSGGTWVSSISAGTRTRRLPDESWTSAWGPDGSIYFVTGGNRLFRLDDTDPEPIHLTDIQGEKGVSNIHVLPDAKGILAVEFDTEMIVSISLEDGTVTPIFAGYSPLYVKSGHLLFVRGDGALMAAPFDLDRMTATGAGTPIGRTVTLRGDESADLFVAENGTLLYMIGGAPESRMVRMTREGVESYLDPDMWEEFGGIALSPDGTRLATSIADPEESGRRIVVKLLPDGPLTVVGTTSIRGAGSVHMSWDVTGRWVYFNSGGGLWMAPSDGSGSPELVFRIAGRGIAEGHVLEDGTMILRTFPGGEGAREMFVVAAGDSIPVPFAPSDADESSPSASPDGRWLAYTSAASATGRVEVFIRPFPEGDALYSVSTNGGDDPLWAHGGRELFFRSPEGDLMAVDVNPGDAGLQLSAPRIVSSRPRSFTRGYAVFPDDQSFLFLESAGEEARYILVLNFFEELKNRVPN